MKDFTKVVRIGQTDIPRNAHSTIAADVFAKIEFKDGKLSITGVEGPRSNGDAYGSCGQIEKPEFARFAPGWDQDLADRFFEAWAAWHLNDMRAGCQHQRATWDGSARLELTPLTWGERYHELRKQATNGTMPTDQFATWADTVALVERLTIATHRPKHPAIWGDEGDRAIAEGLVKADPKGKTSEIANWVSPDEHPDGILTKSCEVCGYKYGTAWLKEDVPQDVIDFLRSLPHEPDTTIWRDQT